LSTLAFELGLTLGFTFTVRDFDVFDLLTDVPRFGGDVFLVATILSV